MRTHNIPFNIITKNHPKLPEVCSYEIFSKGLKNQFETAVVNEPSVFEPLKFYCIRFNFSFYSKQGEVSQVQEAKFSNLSF